MFFVFVRFKIKSHGSIQFHQWDMAAADQKEAGTFEETTVDDLEAKLEEMQQLIAEIRNQKKVNLQD